MEEEEGGGGGWRRRVEEEGGGGWRRRVEEEGGGGGGRRRVEEEGGGGERGERGKSNLCKLVDSFSFLDFLNVKCLLEFLQLLFILTQLCIGIVNAWRKTVHHVILKHTCHSDYHSSSPPLSLFLPSLLPSLSPSPPLSSLFPLSSPPSSLLSLTCSCLLEAVLQCIIFSVLLVQFTLSENQAFLNLKY